MKSGTATNTNRNPLGQDSRCPILNLCTTFSKGRAVTAHVDLHLKKMITANVARSLFRRSQHQHHLHITGTWLGVIATSTLQSWPRSGQFHMFGPVLVCTLSDHLENSKMLGNYRCLWGQEKFQVAFFMSRCVSSRSVCLPSFCFIHQFSHEHSFLSNF